jgi:signal transduction histidine kinase
MQVFTSVVVLIILFSSFIISDIKDYKERKVKSITSLAHVIGTNAVSALQFLDNSAAEDILNDLENIGPEVLYASITDKNGKTFAAYIKKGTAPAALKDTGNNSQSAFSKNRLFVTDDIITENEVIGKVSIMLELTELQSIKKARYQMAAVLLLIAILFSFFIAILVQPYISRRLLYLVNAMQKVIKTGDYNVPIADEGKDEISTVIHAFNDLMQQVKYSQQRKDEFIGIASHELKTPLTSVIGYLDLLRTTEDAALQKLCVEKAKQSAHKLEKLIKDLLDVSKIQSGQLQLNVKAFDIDVLMDETVASLQMVSQQHTIRKENNCKGQVIYADRQRIEQVLINLLSNAIKYSPGKNEVLISCTKNDEELVIRVRDYGVGIPADELQKIFDRFYRTKDSSVHISGFGLGLYICRDIVARHNGKIWAEKEADGSSFYFSLPLNNAILNELQDNFII